MSYLAFVLDEKSRTNLLQHYPPSFPDIICHHVTLRMGNRETLQEHLDLYLNLTNPVFEVVGYGISDIDHIEGFVVMFNGMIFKQNLDVYHITHSIDRSKGAKPVHCKQVLSQFQMTKGIFKVPRYELSGSFQICD